MDTLIRSKSHANTNIGRNNGSTINVTNGASSFSSKQAVLGCFQDIKFSFLRFVLLGVVGQTHLRMFHILLT